MDFITRFIPFIIPLALIAFLCFIIYTLRNRFPIMKEFIEFLNERKLWWMAPIVLFLLIISFLIVVAAYSPLLYPL